MQEVRENRVAVAMSGGVDSSVALLLLKEAGFEVVGFTAKLLAEDTSGSCCSVAAAYNARRVCDKLGVPHYMINLNEPFYEKVITRFVREYGLGRTPNPCVDCNRFIKFKRFLETAESLNCGYLATGHYARIAQLGPGGGALARSDSGKQVENEPLHYEGKTSAGSFRLLRGADPSKDQSYFVAVITREQMKRILFPCGNYTKEEVRRLAEEAGLPTAKTPDSQDVCFLTGGRDLTYWIKLVSGEEPSAGVIRDISGAELGEHKGIEYFTRGQRKGLALGGGPPRYVVDLEPRERAVIVAERGQVKISAIELSQVNILVDGFVDAPRAVSVRTRYRQKEVPARLRSLPCSDEKGENEASGSSRLLVEFEEPQEFISPGQWCVFYDGEVVVGCGLIESLMMEQLSRDT